MTTLPITIEITPSPVSIDAGQVVNFQAFLSTNADSGVTWTLTGSGCSGDGCGVLSNSTKNSVTYTAPPTVTANLTVTLKATSIASSSVTKTAIITVAIAPSFTTTSLPNGGNGVAYNQKIVVAGGVLPLTFKLASGSLPPGLSLNSTGTILGTPSSIGTTTFTVLVTDNGLPPISLESPQYSITINPPPPLSITTTSMPAGTLDVLYTAPVVAQGGVPPLTWSMTGSLPPGLKLNSSTGQITGTPTATGTFAFTPKVQDTAKPLQTAQSPNPLTITIQLPPALKITTLTVPPGTVGTPYNSPITATGGIAPYSWSVSTGLLPAGLKLDPTTGAISGTPILVTTAKFTIRVQDAEQIPMTFDATFNLGVTAGTVDPNSLLKGSYAFSLSGFDSQGSVVIAGVFTADGAGNLSNGAEDMNRVSGVTAGAALTGTYTIRTDGSGTLALKATNNLGQVLNTSYLLALDSEGNAQFIEDDTTGTQGAGIIKPQSATSFSGANFAGNYAFSFTGQDLAFKPTALVGVISSDGGQTLSPGMVDQNEGGTYSPQLSLSGNYATTGTTGRGTSTFTFQLPSTEQVTLTYAFYFVSPSDLFFVGGDPIDATHPRLGGEMILQRPTITFNQSALSLKNITSGSGLNTNASVFVGLSSPDGNGNVTLSYDENDSGVVTSGNVFSGSYLVSQNGRVAFTNLGTRVAAAYLTDRNQGFLIGNDPEATTGVLELQSGGPAFSLSSMQGGLTLSAPVGYDSQANNAVGQILANGTGTLTGTVDEVDASGTPHTAQPLLAAYNVASNGRGTMTSNSPAGFPTQGVFYIVSPAKFRMISTISSDTHPVVNFFNH